MFDMPCKPREVKECFLLADALKAGPFDPRGYRDRLASERRRIASMSEGQLDREISDPDRRARYSGGTWRLTVVELACCSVWPRMGGRQWATGPIPDVAEELRAHVDSADPLFEIAKNVQLSFSDIPLIVFRRKRSAQQYRIDDGCQRAVAYYLAGFRQAFAYVGVYEGRGELGWVWEGERLSA